MKQINISTIEDIAVTKVKSENGAAGSKAAFDKLESKMDGLRGRKMYGEYYPQTNEYFACVKLDDEFSDDMGFEKSTIPGGKYATRKIIDWSSKIQEVAPTFQQLVKDSIELGHKVDDNRPSLEFYRSFRELICMIPIE